MCPKSQNKVFREYQLEICKKWIGLGNHGICRISNILSWTSSLLAEYWSTVLYVACMLVSKKN